MHMVGYFWSSTVYSDSTQLPNINIYNNNGHHKDIGLHRTFQEKK